MRKPSVTPTRTASTNPSVKRHRLQPTCSHSAPSPTVVRLRVASRVSTASGEGRKSGETCSARTSSHHSSSHTPMAAGALSHAAPRARKAMPAAGRTSTRSPLIIVVAPAHQRLLQPAETGIHDEADNADGDHADRHDVRFEVAVAVHDEEAETGSGDDQLGGA